ncbi:hypothetical protein ANO11243_042790 [Dothideomycetidae sp. 11243]|nr:hypothetical protein ANO11243_042790 [fungal sp. No.11243]
MDTPPSSTPASERDPTATGESARQREVFRYLAPWRANKQSSRLYQPVSLRHDGSLDGSPDPSLAGGCDDTTLAAFAQLGSLRLNAQRCMITLFGQEYEYLLAESTRTLSLQSDTIHDLRDGLWMGTSSYAREHGMSDQVYPEWYKPLRRRKPSSREDHYYTDGKTSHWFIVSDLREHSETHQKFLPRFNAYIRFIAAVPLIARSGRVVGAYAILDAIPRFGVSERELVFMEDMAETVVNHLSAKSDAMQKQCAERLIRGLALFSQGGSSLRGWWLDNYDTEKGRSRRQQQIALPQGMTREEQADEEMGQTFTQQKREGHARPAVTHTATSDNDLPGDVQGRDFEVQSVASHDEPASEPAAERPASFDLERATESLFARASNLLREAMDADGVIFLDAGFAQAGGSKRRTSRSSMSSMSGNSGAHSDGETDRTDATYASYATDATDATDASDATDATNHTNTSIVEGKRHALEAGRTRRRKRNQAFKSISNCALLGYSTKVGSSLRGFDSPQRYQTLSHRDMDRLLRRYPDGDLFNFSGDGSIETSSGPDVVPGSASDSAPIVSRIMRTRSQAATLLAGVCDDARSVMFQPLWDSVRDKWRCGMLVWSTSVEKRFTREEDVAYLSAFVNTVAGELVKLDTLASDQAKATFISCVSHELRSPLHGVLAGSDCLLESELTQFQREMATTVKLAGSTLLETVNTILDFAKINSHTDTALNSSAVPGFDRTDSTDVVESHSTNLALLTENVVNTIVAGQRYRSNARASVFSESGSTESTFEREKVQVILTISKRASWEANVPSGTWARIVTNLVGNAVKYTKAGYVHVKLSSVGNRVSLAIQDTGQGISQEYQKHYMFSPFRQGNSHSAGTGLGLYIVKQLTHELNGNIQIESSNEKNHGTKILVDIAPEFDEVEKITEAGDVDLEWRPKGADGKPLELRLMAGSVGAYESSPPNERGGSRDTRDRMVRASVRHTCTDWLDASFKLVREIDDDPEVDLWLMLEGDYLQWVKTRPPIESHDMPKVLVLMEQLGSSQARYQVEKDLGLGSAVDPPFGPFKLGRAINAAMSAPKDRRAEFRMSWKNGNRRGSTTSSDSQMRSTTASPRQPTTPRMPSLMPLRNKDKKLLLVEDNELNMRLLVAWARKLNQPFEQAWNGLDAVKAYTADPSSFLLVLMDVSMPVMDGLAATREIRNHEKQKSLTRCRIVALTGVASAEARRDAEAAGIDVFITKPASLNLVRQLIEDA